MLSEKEIMDIANDYADLNKTQYCLYQLVYVRKSLFLDGYYDVCYRVMDKNGREIDAALMVAIDVRSGQVISLEELIKIQMRMEEGH